jgi:hypothetical protein
MAKKRNNSRTNFATIDNHLHQDSNLSFRARGLFGYMWSMPDDWNFTEDNLAEQNNVEGKKAVRTALKELIQFGYLHRMQSKGNNGKFFSSMVYELYEIPEDNPYFSVLPLKENGTVLPSKENLQRQANTNKLITKENRDILLLKREEIYNIFADYVLLYSENEQKYLKIERENICRRIFYNLDSSVGNLKRYVTTSIENELRKFYAIEDLNKYPRTNIDVTNPIEYTQEEKEVAIINWNEVLMEDG